MYCLLWSLIQKGLKNTNSGLTVLRRNRSPEGRSELPRVPEGALPSAPALFRGPPLPGRMHLCRLLPTHKVKLGPRVSGSLRVPWGQVRDLDPSRRRSTGAAGGAHLGTWPSCLVGTCDTRCCSWCRCGGDTSQPTDTRSGTGNRREHVCAGTPGAGSAHRHLQLPSEPKLWHRWAKALKS